MKRAVGYVRVSSRNQAEKGESLETQRKAIRAYANAHEWELVHIYADEGISGADTKKRPDFQELIKDAESKKFDIVIVHNLSRFSRKLIDNLTYVPLLKKIGVDFVSITEHIDLSSPAGELIFNIFSSLADFYRKEIKQRMLENRISRAKRGVPVTGKLPIGRKYDKETGEWSLDEKIANLLKWAAEEYLEGKSLKDIAYILKNQHKIPISYSHMHEILSEKCGAVWRVKFEEEPEPIIYEIPRILGEETIKAVKERVAFNRNWNRKDVKNKYLLTGFVRCGECRKTLVGQTMKSDHGKFDYQYYRHLDGKYRKCGAFSSIKAGKIEDAVFKTIFENTMDEEGFEKALQENMPDANYIKSLEKSILENKKKLNNTKADLEKLVTLAMDGTLQKETIRKKEGEIYKLLDTLDIQIASDTEKLKNLPDPDRISRDGELIRLSLMDYFGSEERMVEMPFDEKRQLLHRIFSGTDEDGRKHGIYIKKRGKNIWDYEINACLFAGERTLKGDEIDSDDWDPPEWIKKIIIKNESETFKTNLHQRGHRNIQDIQRCRNDAKGSGPDHPAALSLPSPHDLRCRTHRRGTHSPAR